MMSKLEEAIIYATIMHQGKLRIFSSSPYILHPIEVAQILSTMTDDEEVIAAGILHDIVESTDGTIEEIEKRFGKRVAYLVDSDSENRYDVADDPEAWKKRKEESLLILKDSDDTGVQMLWLADRLSDIRALNWLYSEKGESIWEEYDENAADVVLWYFRTIAETVELQLNKTGAFKEMIKHINFLWPGTFNSDKAKFKKYKEVSIDGCRLLASGAKGEVYRYDDELIIKVFNHKNTYHDVEREIALSRKAFIIGIPTAISFGIVAVGERYGAMYELLDSDTVSGLIKRNPKRTNTYARKMAELAHTMHSIKVAEEDGFPAVTDRLCKYIHGGVGREDEALAARCLELLDTVPASETLVHGDFHTNNVFLQNGEPLLIDLDRLSMGHPIAEISDLYYFYVVLGEEDPSVVENFMGFSYKTARRFFDAFLRCYLDTEDENILSDVKQKAEFICCIRMINKIHKKVSISEEDRELIDRYMAKVRELSESLTTLAF